MKSDDFVSVRLFGGLGNQIFQYMAGKSLAIDRNCQLHVDSGWLRDGYSHEKSTISEFKFFLPEHQYEQMHRNRIHLYIDRLATVFARNSRVVARLLRINAPKSVGFEDLTEIECGTQLRGYYQSPRYFEKLVNSGVISQASFELLQPSKAFKLLASQLETSGYIAIHVRGGDYLNKKSEYVELPIDYYLDALNLLDTKYGHLPKWVFTDDEDHARKLFASVIGLNFIENESMTAAESMILMSRADAIICANSTFSYWASLINGQASSIVLPRTWMERTSQSEDFFINGWQVIDSTKSLS
jgi:hypothetical protein